MDVNIPVNWKVFEGEKGFEAAPEGAFGNRGITHGISVGTFEGKSASLQSITDEFIASLIKENQFLKPQGISRRGLLAGQSSRITTLSGRSPITGQIEIATVHTAKRRNGEVGYLITVVPGIDEVRYSGTFKLILDSVRIY